MAYPWPSQNISIPSHPLCHKQEKAKKEISGQLSVLPLLFLMNTVSFKNIHARTSGYRYYIDNNRWMKVASICI